MALSLASWKMVKSQSWQLSLSFLVSKYSIPFWLFLISGIASSFLAINVVESYWVLIKDFLFFGLLILLPAVYAHFKNWKTYFFKGFLLAILISAIYGFYQLYQELQTIGAETIDLYNLNSTFAHRNLWAGFLVLAMPFLVFSIQSFKGFWRFFAFALVFNNLFWIYFLESRSSWLALGIFILMYFATGILAKFKFRLSRIFSRLSLLIFGLVIGIGFFVFYFSAKNDLQSQELGFDLKVEASEKSFTVQERVLLWKGTALMIQDNNLLGVGPGNWKILFPKYGSDIWRARQGLVQFQRPHNDFLWVLSEQGIIGLLSYVFMFLVMINFALKNSENQNLSREERILSRLILAGLMAYLCFAFFSFPKERIFHQWILYVSFSILIFDYFKGIKSNNKGFRKYWIITLATVLIGFSGFWLGLQRWKAEIQTRNILAFNNHSQWKDMADLSKRVKDFPFYKMDPSSVPISFYQGLAELNLNNKQKALELFLEAEKVHPNMIQVINNIAAVYQFNNDHDLAIEYFQRALKISPKYQDGILNLAATYFNANRVMESYQILLDQQSAFPEDDANYSAYVLVLLKVIQGNVAETISDQKLKNAILQLNDDWLKQIHEKLGLDEIPVDQRMIMDAIYGMENLDKSISQEQAEDYKNLYLNK